MSKKVRTRFAPSPTGYLHVGGIRTALFAWLVARQSGGQFILRLEDTDKKREVEGSAEHLIECLRTLGLDYDEGPDTPGSFGPYRQSERLKIYKKWAQKLIDSGRAYADPYTPEEVQRFREQAQKAKQPFLYRNHRPSLEALRAISRPEDWYGKYPLRFKSDPKKYAWHDEVMGDLKTGPEVIDDFILIKSDGYPTYNFCHIVDDAEMEISHIIRAQEFISSVPNYLNLYEALGIFSEDDKRVSQDSIAYQLLSTNCYLPTFATMPHILNEQGNKKLGKRDSAKDVLDYVREGFLPDALVSFIATLGWNDGTEQEVFTRNELIKKFSLDRVGKSGAHFDQKRLLWVNGHFIRELPLDELYEKTADYWPEEAKDASDEYRKSVLGLVQERLKYFAELPELTRFFFVDLPVDKSLIENNKQLKKVDKSRLKELLQISLNDLQESDFTSEDIQNRLNHLLEQTAEKPAILFSIIRIATTWAPASPALADTLAVLGKDVVLMRLEKSLQQM